MSRVFYVFPYFHVASRRRYCGVLAFARQTSIGFVVHESHPAFADWTTVLAGSRSAMDVKYFGRNGMVRTANLSDRFKRWHNLFC